MIVQDFVKFRWDYLTGLQTTGGWGPLTTNVLFVGQKDVVTPCHYDEQENLFAQVHGRKRCVLFDPKYFECLYPFRVGHPCDRQSQVDFTNPDLTKFPLFPKARGVEAIVEPGDVLYIPKYWFHHIISLDETVSVNFWYHASKVADIVYPLNPTQKMAISRNIEKMILTALQSGSEVSH